MFRHLEYLFVCVTVKTNPPSRVRAISEDGFPTSLLINWTHPIPEDYLRLIYEIRFCARGSSHWDYVSLIFFLDHWKLGEPLQSLVKELVCEM